MEIPRIATKEQANQIYREMLKSAGFCTRTTGCREPVADGSTYCEVHRLEVATKAAALRAQKIANGQCTWGATCTEPPAEDTTFCIEHIGQKRLYGRSALERQKEAVYAHYGDRCVCCGEENKVFLTIDHVNGNGADMRRSDKSHKNLPSWLVKHDFPEGFQILCSNCNSAKARLGQCPHQNSAI